MSASLAGERREAEADRSLPRAVTGGFLLSRFCFLGFLSVEEFSVCLRASLFARSVCSTARPFWRDLCLLPCSPSEPLLLLLLLRRRLGFGGASGGREGFSEWLALALLCLGTGSLSFLSGPDVSLGVTALLD